MGHYKQKKSKTATQQYRIINNRMLLDHTNELFKSPKILKIYQLNILSLAVFIYQIRNKTVPLTFLGSFEKVSHGCRTNFSQFNYKNRT